MDSTTPGIDFAIIGHQDSWQNVSSFINSIRRHDQEELSIENIKNVFPFIPARDIFRIKARSKTGIEINGVYIETFIDPCKLDAPFIRTNISKVMHAVTCAKKMGAGIVTLGGFTSIVLEGNIDLLSSVETKFTTGNTLTAAYIVKGIEKAAIQHAINLNKSAVLIIGATGDIGMACISYLKNKAGKFLLCARNEKRLEKLSKELIKENIEVDYAVSLEKLVPKADIIICVASSSGIKLDSCKKNVLICDAGYPKNIETKMEADIGLHLFHGGMGQVSEGYDFNPDYSGSIYRYPASHITHGCILEAVVLAFENKFEEYSTGKGNITREKMEDIYGLSLKHGIDVAPFTIQMDYGKHGSHIKNTVMKKEKDQVSLFKLVFTHNWEDPESDHAALKIKNNDAILAITSGGCNVLGFLLLDPQVIYSVDINPTQSYMLELKIAAIKNLSFEDFISFAGLKQHNNRLELYNRIKPSLSREALEFWECQDKILTRGFIMNGKYEGFIKLAGKFLNLLQGKKRVLGLFNEKTQEEQRIYFDHVWNTKRFHYMFKILFNKRMLAKRGLVADYFHFDDGSTSFAESFYKRSRKAFRDISIKGNYFLSLYLQGKYRNDKEVPAYLLKENFDVIRSRVDRIQIITAEAQTWIDSMDKNSIDCFALSNICELMSEKDTKRLFTSVYRTARQSARVIFRNLMIPRDVPDDLNKMIVKDEPLSKYIYENDRSFVYGKVAAYTIGK